MSYEAAILSAGGNDSMLSKSFIIAADETAMPMVLSPEPRSDILLGRLKATHLFEFPKVPTPQAHKERSILVQTERKGASPKFLQEIRSSQSPDA
jgi:hypothetical protein